MGFIADHDVEPGNGMRIVQLTPPGSACSIVIGTGMGISPETGTITQLHLVLDDIDAARHQLVGRHLDVSEGEDMGGVKYEYFSDPDANSWAVQEITSAARPQLAGPVPGKARRRARLHTTGAGATPGGRPGRRLRELAPAPEQAFGTRTGTSPVTVP